MSFDAHANLANSVVAVAPVPDTSGTSLSVAVGTGALFPAAPFNCIVCPANTLPTQGNAEIVRVTGVVGDDFTIIRAQEGTTAKNIAAGYYIANAITVKTLTDVEAAAGVPSVQGTANQVLVDGTSGSPEAGALVLTLPQDIGTASTPQFGGIGLAVAPQSHRRLRIGGTVTSNGSSAEAISASATLAAAANGDIIYGINLVNLQVSKGAFTGLTVRGVSITPSLLAPSGAGTIDDAYGLYITGGVSGATNNYSIFTASGAGIVSIGNATDSTSVSTGSIITAGGLGVAKSIRAGGPIVPPSYTVGTLPAAASYTYGLAAVSDANEAAGTGLGTAPTGGGAVKRMVYSDGANWLLM